MGLKIFDLYHLTGSVIVACMGVHIQGNACVRVAHQILQILNVHACVGIVGAKGMPEHMGRDVG